MSTDDDLQWWVANSCITALINFAGIGQNDTEVCSKCPLTSQVADEIDLILENGLRAYRDFRKASEYIITDSQCSKAAAALVSIAAPLGDKTSLAMIMDLAGRIAPSRISSKTFISDEEADKGDESDPNH